MTKWWSGAGPRSKVSAVIAGVLVLIGIYLCVLAVGPGLRPDGWAGWFGEPGSWPTALIVVALAGLAVWLRLSESGRRTAGSAVTLVAATGGVSLVLGLASFWRCPTDQVPGVGSLASTLALFVAGGRAPADGSAACMQSPVAYDLARAGGVLVVLTLLAGVVYTVFRPQFDRAAVIVPNSNLVSGVVKNLMRTDRVGRLTIELTVHASSDPEKVREVLIDIARDNDNIVSLPSPQVRFTDLSGSAMTFSL